jgi:hypothetical protein
MTKILFLAALLFSGLLSPASGSANALIDLGVQSMGTTQTTFDGPLFTVTPNFPPAVTFSDPAFSEFLNCALPTPSGIAMCRLDVTFTAPVTPGPLNSEVPVSATMTVDMKDGSPPQVFDLHAIVQRSLVAHYYQSILRRVPDPSGADYWGKEASRIQLLGADVSETWYAMAAYFFSSAEYVALPPTDAKLVADAYRTFLGRDPDVSGLAYWQGQISAGMPREVVLTSFMFSQEFTTFTSSLFGNTSVRPEVNLVMDFYRGMLSRLPDNAGANGWIATMRTAQCTSLDAVAQQADAIARSFIGSPEYQARHRSVPQYVGDLYNAYLRRGGDLSGVKYWIDQLVSGLVTREQVRQAFAASPEFGARLQVVAAAPCNPPDSVHAALDDADARDVQAVLGADGHPVIAYRKSDGTYITICGDEGCTTGNVTRLIEAGSNTSAIPAQLAVAIGADGAPIVAYNSLPAGTSGSPIPIRFAKCGDAACSTVQATTVLMSAPHNASANFALAVGPDGLPVFALEHWSDIEFMYFVEVVKCGSAACDSGNVVTKLFNFGTGSETIHDLRLTISADNMPGVSMMTTSFSFQYVKCQSVTCSAHTPPGTQQPLGPVPGMAVAIAQGDDPRIVYGTTGVDTHAEVDLMSCNDYACSLPATVKTMEYLPGPCTAAACPTANATAIDIDSAGLPLIAYTAGTYQQSEVYYAKCLDTACAALSRHQQPRTLPAGTPFTPLALLRGISGRVIAILKEGSRVQVRVCSYEDCR